jgi:hypothetical protein
MTTRKTYLTHRSKEILVYLICGPFMLIGGIAYVISVGLKTGWAWGEYLGEKYL